MRARCGRCQTELEVQGAGRFECPACGAVNEVRAGAGSAPPPGGAPPGYPPGGAPGMEPGGGMPGVVSPPPPPEAPSEKTRCPSCDFSFIVGDIAIVVCPMCGEEVSLGDAG